MIFVLYAFLAMGVWLLALDIRGRLTAPPERIRWWQRVGIAAAAGPGLAPLLAWILGRLEVTWPYPMIAVGYLCFFLAFAAGILAREATRAGTLLRRGGYVGLLLLGALPSWVLLLLTPLVALAGLGLVRPETVHAAEKGG